MSLHNSISSLWYQGINKKVVSKNKIRLSQAVWTTRPWIIPTKEFSKSADIQHFQSQLIVYISKVSWLFKFSNSADCLHFQSLLLALACQDFYSLIHYLGYEKILGLRGGRTGKKTITRSASWRFLALKKCKTGLASTNFSQTKCFIYKNFSSEHVKFSWVLQF